MKFEDLNFIALGGNCLSMYVLGPNRLRGPVDNIMLYDKKPVEYLLEDKFLSYILDNPPTITEKAQPNEHEGPYNYTWPKFIEIVHNKFDEVYKEHLAWRVFNFNTFYDKLKKNKQKYFFIFTISKSFMNSATKTLRSDKLIGLIKLLKKYDLLNNVIFVGAKASKKINHYTWYNYWIPTKDLELLKNKYQIKYIELSNLNFDKENGKQEAFRQFKSKVIIVLESKKFKQNKSNAKTINSYLGYSDYGL